MTINQKRKEYLKTHYGATIKDYNNQRHRMHIIQYGKIICSNHPGSKSLKTLLQVW